MSYLRTKLGEEHVIGGATFSESTTQHKLTVPPGKRYIIHAMACDNDVNSTVTVRVMTAGDVQIDVLLSEAATTSHVSWPRHSTGSITERYLDAGEYVQWDFGVAQTGGAYIITKYFEVTL